MRIVYYTYPWFFDASISLIRAIGRKVELHVIIEVPPEGRRAVLFDLTSISLPSGIVPAEPVLAPLFPACAREYWGNLASFHLAVFNKPKSIHLDTLVNAKSIINFIRTIQPDMILFEDISLRIGLGSVFLRDVPWVIGVHDPEPHLGERNWRQSLSRRLVFGRATRFVLHNRTQKREFETVSRTKPDQSEVIRLGPYDVYRSWDSPEVLAEEKSVLFFGRLSQYKGLEVLLSAASQVCERIGNVTFYIVGEPVGGYELPSLPILPNGGRMILIERHVSPGELAGFFGRSICVVCPYIDATQSGVVLTAYAFDMPVIATGTGGLSEYVFDGRTGLLVRPNDPHGLAEAIVRYLSDSKLREELRTGIDEIKAGSLNWDHIAEQYKELFERVSESG